MDKKPSDKGNRRRFMKNVARFCKNPIGYTYWKFPLQRTKLNPYAVFIGLCCFKLFHSFRGQVEEKDKKCAFLVTKGYKKGGELDLSLPDQETKLGNNVNFLNAINYDKVLFEDFVVNPSYRQNFRKYIEMGLWLS